MQKMLMAIAYCLLTSDPSALVQFFSTLDSSDDSICEPLIPEGKIKVEGSVDLWSNVQIISGGKQRDCFFCDFLRENKL